MSIEQFVLTNPSDENMFRSIVLFGRNVASYKFALATALIDFGSQGRDRISLVELAEPYALSICGHLSAAPKQVTSSGSKFLEKCAEFNSSAITKDQLIDTAVRLGFQNVFDAFHHVGTSDVPTQFFIDERKSSKPSIVLTKELQILSNGGGLTLKQETNSRWNLVETAWGLGTTAAIIGYDSISGDFTLPVKRKTITSARAALNGYQVGRCFYCYDDIAITPGDKNLADVDHLFPHVLEKRNLTSNLDGIWNLVLACQTCNRGTDGKFDSTPHPKYVARLHKRNEYLILSHHPLRETLISQTGPTAQARKQFLQKMLTVASNYQAAPWMTQAVGNSSF